MTKQSPVKDLIEGLSRFYSQFFQYNNQRAEASEGRLQHVETYKGRK